MAQSAAPFPGQVSTDHRPGGAWWRVLLSGIVLYFVGLVLLVLSGNPNLFPTVVILGSFMVPATYVAFFYERRHLSLLSAPTTALAFFWGGVLGVFAATILEPLFVSNLDFLTAFGVGLIEEFVKILGVLWIARRIRHDSELDGLILGAAAGMSFAALESLGYAFTAFLGSRGSLSVVVAVTLMRGLFSPLGHGTWTAILVGVLFRESSVGRFHINRRVVGAYFTVVVLHWLWDGIPSVVSDFVSSGADVFLAQVLVGTVGLVILWRRWREARRLQESQAQIASAPIGLQAPATGEKPGLAEEVPPRDQSA